MYQINEGLRTFRAWINWKNHGENDVTLVHFSKLTLFNSISVVWDSYCETSVVVAVEAFFTSKNVTHSLQGSEFSLSLLINPLLQPILYHIVRKYRYSPPKSHGYIGDYWPLLIFNPHWWRWGNRHTIKPLTGCMREQAKIDPCGEDFIQQTG